MRLSLMDTQHNVTLMPLLLGHMKAVREHINLFPQCCLLIVLCHRCRYSIKIVTEHSIMGTVYQPFN